MRQARDRVRRTGRPHNLARALFDVEIVHALADQVAERIGADPLGGENLLSEADRAEIRRELREEPEIRAALDELWPVLTPQRLLADLYASPERIAAAAPMLTDAERAALHREPGRLDARRRAAAGRGRRTARRGRARRRGAAGNGIRALEREYAEGVLEIWRGSRSIDVEDEADGGEILGVTDLIDADRLSERQEESDRLTTAERAAADRTWAFGHVIVDEAQELSPMAWRLLMRRCPSRSMTIVGDVAQTGALAGTPSWGEALAPYVADRWRLEELTVNYRTPAEIMAVAADVLRRDRPGAAATPLGTRHRRTAVGPDRAGGPPRDRTGRGDRPGGRVARRRAARRAGAHRAGGRAGRRGGGGAAGGDVGEQPELANRVVVLTTEQAKGLEFDSVLVVDPARIVSESPRGHSDLYVALTRATQRLGILRTP